MKQPRGNRHIAKKTAIIIAIVIAALVTVVAGLFHHYYGMMNYVERIKNYVIADEIADDNADTEDEWKKLWDSMHGDNAKNLSEEEQAKLDEQLSNYLRKNGDIMADEDVYNILLIGTDSRKNDTSGRSDAIVLVSINNETKDITMTSILRDCYIYIPGVGSDRINAAYAYGGPELLIDTIEQNFNIKINKYMQTNFFAFVDIVDALGGIEMTITDDEARVMNETYVTYINKMLGRPETDSLLNGGGDLTLDGVQALSYVRVRYLGNGDFDRSERQRKALMAVYDKVQSSSALQINSLLGVFLPQIQTDMTEDECLSILLNLADYYLNYEIHSLTIPASGTYSDIKVRGMAVMDVDYEKNSAMLTDAVYNGVYPVEASDPEETTGDSTDADNQTAAVGSGRISTKSAYES
ncbi:MAG: LCP family protein [Butyricicoccaceae bacterium]